MNPTLALFLRLTLGITALFIAIIIAFDLLKVAIVAAILAGAALGALLLWRRFGRSVKLPTLR